MTDTPGIDAVVFDLDGTLADTEHVWDEVRRGLAHEDGVPWPADATRAMMGMSTAEWSAYLADQVGLTGTAEDAERRTLDALAERYRDHLPVVPGAADAVRRIAAVWPVGLATSTPRRLIDTILDAVGVRELFGVTVSTEEVAAGKPSPDAYLRACELMRVEPHRAVAVEDSANGIRSAHAAGLAVVAIPPRFEPPGPEVLALAAVTLPDITALTSGLVRTLGDARSGPTSPVR